MVVSMEMNEDIKKLSIETSFAILLPLAVDLTVEV